MTVNILVKHPRSGQIVIFTLHYIEGHWKSSAIFI